MTAPLQKNRANKRWQRGGVAQVEQESFNQGTTFIRSSSLRTRHPPDQRTTCSHSEEMAGALGQTGSITDPFGDGFRGVTARAAGYRSRSAPQEKEQRTVFATCATGHKSHAERKSNRTSSWSAGIILATPTTGTHSAVLTTL